MNIRKIAVIAGGDSSEAVVSLRSAAEVYASLDRSLFEPYIVTVSGSDWRTETGESIDKNYFSFMSKNGTHVKFDYALIMIHGTPGENGILQGYLELMSIPYSSCNTAVSALTFDKSLCKKAIADLPNVNLAHEILVRKGDKITPERYITELGLPFFVKPNASGSSFGVTKVKTAEQIDTAITEALTEGVTVLLEEYIEGVEVSQGVMITSNNELALPVTELVSKNEFFDYEAKYTDGMTEEITPARIPQNVTEILNQTTLDIYKALGCEGIVRIDYIIKGEKPYFIEVNTVPGMSRNSIVPKQLREAGMTMQQAYTMIISDKLNN